MTPEEFNHQLRREVGSRIDRFTTELLKLVGTPEGNVDHDKLNTFLSDPGAALAQHNLIHPERQSDATRLAVAIYSSVPIAEHVRRATQNLVGDRSFLTTLERLARDPSSLSSSDREAAIDAILQNENIIVGTLMAVLSDRSVQEVLGLPSDFSVESYIVRLRRAIRDSADLTSFRGTAAVSSAVSEVEPAMFCDVAV